MPKKYTEERKCKVVQNCLDGMPIQEISQTEGIAVSTIYRWIKDCETDAPVPSYSALLYKKEHLEHVLEVICLSGLIDEVPLRRRLDILETLHMQHEEFNVHELCEALNVARGTFYNHIFRSADRTRYMEEQRLLMQQVQQIFDDSEQRFGAEKIRNVLSENGIHVGKRESEKLCRSLV